MYEVNVLAIFTAAVTGFVISMVWYSLLPSVPGTPGVDSVQESARPTVWKVLVELVRSLVVASVLTGLARGLGIVDVWSAVVLGLAMWFGFPCVLLLGSVIWENVPWRVAALHAGDWLVKLVIIALIVGMWR